MRTGNVIFLLAAVFAVRSVNADTVVLGRAVDQRPVPNVDDGCEPTADTLCLGYPWFYWTLAIDRTLSGPPLSGRVITVRQQHAPTIRSYQRSYRLFVVRPIEDSADRKQLGADYYLIDMSEPHYCISSDPEEFGLKIGGVVVEESEHGDTYCFALH